MKKSNNGLLKVLVGLGLGAVCIFGGAVSGNLMGTGFSEILLGRINN